jgi:hypothetical protein
VNFLVLIEFIKPHPTVTFAAPFVFGIFPDNMRNRLGFSMKEWQSLAQAKWECKYHVAIVPKHRKKVLYGKLKRRTGEILRELGRYKGIETVEAHAMADHIHMCI